VDNGRLTRDLRSRRGRVRGTATLSRSRDRNSSLRAICSARHSLRAAVRRGR
jgi:hypothetical protein